MFEVILSIKYMNVVRFGGYVVLYGDNFDVVKEECVRREKQDGFINILLFDDFYVIVGQGIIGNELFGQVNMFKVEVIFCCVGGGGFIVGIGLFVKCMVLYVKIIGVEVYDVNVMVQLLKKGERVVLDNVGFFVDGVVVRIVGEEIFCIVWDVVDDVIEVLIDEICVVMKDMYDDI